MSRGDWLVAQKDLPIRECPCPDRLEIQLFFELVEHRSPTAQDDRIHEKLVLIDQAFRRQLRNNTPLPKIAMPGPDWFLIVRTASAMSFFTTVVLPKGGLCSVLENTIFGMRFMASATTGSFLIAVCVG